MYNDHNSSVELSRQLGFSPVSMERQREAPNRPQPEPQVLSPRCRTILLYEMRLKAVESFDATIVNTLVIAV